MLKFDYFTINQKLHLLDKEAVRVDELSDRKSGVKAQHRLIMVCVYGY